MPRIGLDRTGVPVEWDEVKEQLTAAQRPAGPAAGLACRARSAAFVNQAADTFDGNGDSFRNALRELSQTAGRLGDSRTDLFGTVRNLQVLVNALSNSNEQIVQFSNHVASVSQVLADSSQGPRRHARHAQPGARATCKGFLNENNEALIGSVGKLADFTKILTDHSDDIEQVLHITPNGLANFYNIYNPAQGTVGGLLSLPNFANPVQFICGGTFDTGANPDNYKRAEICRQRMGPVLQADHDELPADPVPPDQQHHRLQGPDHLRHPGNRGEGADAGAVPAVAARARCDTADHAQPGRHAERPGPAAARRCRVRSRPAGPASGRATDGPGPAARPAARGSRRPPVPAEGGGG